MAIQPELPGPVVAGLGDLADPTHFTQPIGLNDWSRQELLQALRGMLVIRHAEEVIAKLVEEGEAKAPCHLGIGQEAIAVGVSTQLRSTDRVFGGHRSHSHYLALGGEVYPLLAEVLGRLDGTSRGMGGSMHLVDRAHGFHGSVPLVGATIPIAVGAGLAAKLDGGTDIAVTYFGDGAAEEGVFHESMNLAMVYQLPVLFVCENNLFASHMDIGLRQPSDRVARFAEAHCMRHETVDGNDVVQVAEATRRLVDPARAGRGPALLEAVTYRHRGHVGPKEDIDVGVHRRPDDIRAWKKRCPIERLTRTMQASGMITAAESDGLSQEVRRSVEADAARARKALYPPASALLDLVWAHTPGA